MAKTKSKTRLVLFTLFCGVAVLGLLRLGFWQLDRLVWKQETITRIEKNMAKPAVPLEKLLSHETSDFKVYEYRRFSVTAPFDDRQNYNMPGKVYQGVQGFYVLTPVMLEDGSRVIVHRGFVPDGKAVPFSRGVQEFTAILRVPGGQGPFVPDNDPAQNQWTWFDLPAMGSTVPFYLQVEADATAGGTPAFPRPVGAPVRLMNNHFQYAITWFLLAFVVVAGYGVYVRQSGVIPGKKRALFSPDWPVMAGCMCPIAGRSLIMTGSNHSAAHPIRTLRLL